MKLLLYAIIFALFFYNAKAQSVISSDTIKTTNFAPFSGLNHGPRNNIIAEFYGLLSLPQGQFKYVSNNMVGLGLGGAILYNPFSKVISGRIIRPYIIGVQLDDTRFSSNTIKSEINHRGRLYEQEYEFKTKGLSVGYIGKVELFDAKLYPVLLFQAGFRFFKGRQEINYTAFEPDEQAFAPDNFGKNLSGASTSYWGYGGGIGYGTNTIRMELRCIQQRGNTASYIDTESIDIFPDNTYRYNTKTSKTDVFITQLNISLRF